MFRNEGLGWWGRMEDIPTYLASILESRTTTRAALLLSLSLSRPSDPEESRG